jgi:3-dehydroquinate dehydratase/shikimate dehydrogenase
MVEALSLSGASQINAFGADRICGVIAAPTAAQAKKQVRAAVSRYKARILELRLDYLRSESDRIALLRFIKSVAGRNTLIATCRSRRGAGRFSGGTESELAILMQAVKAGCRWCDVEVEIAEQFPPGELRQILSPARILVSAHDFRQTPRDLNALVRRLQGCGGDALKIATNCQSLAEVLRLLALVRGRRDLIVIPMGEALAPRILAIREGSALGYASLGQDTAPGQASLDDLRKVYRLDRRFGGAAMPNRRTRVYGVIGNPIGHSLSPVMHNAAFAARKMNAVFLPFLVRNLDDFINSVDALGISGFAVTIPHKQAILGYLDECDPLAARIGAVNTVVVRGDGRLFGYNTDYAGVLRAIERRVPLRGSRVLLIGAGGAARAAAFALAHAGSAVVVWARRPGQARSLARAVRGTAIERKAIRHEFFDAIVNCTPVGMHPEGGAPLAAAELNCHAVMDLIYRPRKTELLRRAERRGLEIISGEEMFLAQGAAQWRLWTSRRAPTAVMRAAVNSALDRDGA